MKLPQMTGKELIRLLQKAGFKIIGQRGQHVSLRKGNRRLIIPFNETLAEQTLLNIIDQANLEAKDIVNLLQDHTPAKPLPDDLLSGEQSGETEPVPVLTGGFWPESWYATLWGFPLALFRILLGVLFLDFAFGKAPADFGWFPAVVENNIQIPSFAWYQSFYEFVVQPNLQVWGWVQFVVELVVGVCLILGVFTVFYGYVGAFWASWFAIGALAWPHEWAWAYILWVAGCLLIASSRAGRSFGADLRISEWCENNPNSRYARFFRWLV